MSQALCQFWGKKMKSNMTCCYFSQEAYSLLNKTDINQTIIYNEHKFTNQAKLSDAKETGSEKVQLKNLSRTLRQEGLPCGKFFS